MDKKKIKNVFVILFLFLLVSWNSGDSAQEISDEDLTGAEFATKILSENKGKVIFLDCWSTWCSPCVKSMPDSKTLMEKFKDEDVVFIYVCIESFQKSWERVVPKFNHNLGQHYRLTMKQSKSFKEMMKVEYVPTYFLIDKKGEVIEQGFHLHPGDKLTEEKIIKLTEE